MADELPPLPQGAVMEELPPLPAGASFDEGTTERYRGGYKRQVREAFERPAEKPPAPTMGELGEKYKDVGIGAVSAIPGLPGDIEALGRVPLRPFGVSRETVLPTSEEVASTVFGPAETKEQKINRALGGLVGPSALGKALGFGVRGVVGRPTAATADLAKKAEDLGFRLEAGQLRAAEPTASPGFALNAPKNQKLANELVTAETGTKAAEITPKYVGKRLEDLGKVYDNIFNRTIKIDRGAENELKAIIDFESRVNPAAVRPAASASQNIIERFNQARQQVGPTVSSVGVDGRELQRLRSELSNIARTASDANDRRIAGNFVESIDKAIERSNPALAAKLLDTNRKYATAKTLEEMIEKGYVRQGNISLEKLGEHLANNTYGFGSGTSRHPLYNLGYMGRELNMRAMWEGATGTSKQALDALIGKAGKYIGGALGLRTQAARRAQRGEPMLPGETGKALGLPSAASPKEGEQ
jgi:ribosomal protein S7